MEALGKNVFQSSPAPADAVEKERLVKHYLSQLTLDVYLIDYQNDESLTYIIPLSIGEYLVVNGYIDECIEAIGGQGLLNKIESMSWFLLLLLEIFPGNFSMDKVDTYKAMFRDGDDALPGHPLPDGVLDYDLWEIYYNLTEMNADFLHSQEILDKVQSLELLTTMERFVMYSYILRKYRETAGREQMNYMFEMIFRHNRFNTVRNDIRQQNLGMNFGLLGYHNKHSVLTAKWYVEGYANVRQDLNLEKGVRYDRRTLSEATDDALLDYCPLAPMYLGRADLVFIVYQVSNYFNGATLKIKTETKSLVVTQGRTDYSIVKSKLQNGEVWYKLEPRDYNLERKLQNLIRVVDYKDDSPIYDQMINPYIEDDSFEELEEFKKDLGYMYLFFMVQAGKYQSALGEPRTRIKSILYRNMLADYKSHVLESRNYKVPVVENVNGMLIQSHISIGKLAKSSFNYSVFLNTCRMYRFTQDEVITVANKIWTKKYFDGNGRLYDYTEKLDNTIMICFNFLNYIKYCRRLSDKLFITNRNPVGRIKMYKEEDPQFQQTPGPTFQPTPGPTFQPVQTLQQPTFQQTPGPTFQPTPAPMQWQPVQTLQQPTFQQTPGPQFQQHEQIQQPPFFLPPQVFEQMEQVPQFNLDTDNEEEYPEF